MKKSFIAATLVVAGSVSAEIDPIVIEYTSRDRLDQLTNSGAIKTYSNQEIINSGAQTLGQFISQLSGVNTTDTSGNGLEPSVGLGAFGPTASQNTQVLVNGLPFNLGTLESPALSVIHFNQVDRIEVLSGGASVSYGNGAVSGAINIITKPAASNSVFAEAGSFDYSRTSVTTAFAGDTHTTSISFSAASKGGYRDHTDYSIRGLNLNSTFGSEGLKHRITGSINEVDQKTHSGSTTAMLASNPRGGSTEDTSKRNHIMGAYQVSGLDSLVDSISFSAQNSRGSGTVSGTNQFSKETMQQFISAEKQLSNFLAISIDATQRSLEFDNDAWNPGGARIPTGQDNSQSEVGITAKYNKILASGLELSAGSRLASVENKVNRSFVTYDPAFTTATLDSEDLKSTDTVGAMDAGLAMPLANSFVGFLRAETNYRAATMDENSDRVNGSGLLEVQEGIGTHAGIRYESEQLQAEVVLNRLKLDNEIAYDGSDNINLDSTHRTGLNLSVLRLIGEGSSLRAEASYQDAKVTAGAFEGGEIPLVPEKSARITWTTNVDMMRYNIAATYKSERVAASDWQNDGAMLASSIGVSAGVSRKWNDIEVAVRINNLINRDDYTYGVVSGGTNYYVPSEPRNFTLSISYRPD